MAESVTIAAKQTTPTPDPVLNTALPNTPSSTASLTNRAFTTEVGGFLKPANPRKRSRNPGSPLSASIASASLGKPPSQFSPKSVLSPLTSPVELTAAAEMSEQKKRKIELEREQARQQSPNPQRTALGALLGGQGNGMSRPADAPTAATTLNATIASIAPAISIPHHAQGETSLQTSPVSMSSFGTLESTGAVTTTANGVQVASPVRLAEDLTHEPEPTQINTPARAGTDDGHPNKAFTFPGPLLGLQANDPRRGVSLPGSSNFARDDSRSPSSSNKKHKCPYCATEFTRHHNLKSHLLTHSHEKPYMCQTCDSRFRRLHDLKRHTKLHTGERPHVCPKCKRSFARGDALARHNKGQGGCAGRRSSVGSYGGDGPGGDEGMEGILYAGEASHEPDNIDDEEDGGEERGQTLPSIRRHEAPPESHYRPPQDSEQAYQSRQPSTYPPVAMKQSSTMRGLYPPTPTHGGSSASTSPGTPGTSIPAYVSTGSITSSFQGPGPSVFAQGSMTESPKPLSPGGMIGIQQNHSDSGLHRNRSPSLTQQFQQQQFGRRTLNRAASPPMSLPLPTGGSAHSHAPHLPSLVGLNPPEPRYTLPSQTAGPTHAPLHPSGGVTPTSYHSQHGGMSSNSNSHSSHGTQPHGSGDRATLPYPQAEDRIWAIVRALEAKVDRLQEEVTSLRNQVAAGST
ncbi:Zinc finger and SCAN domain-containing protein 5B, partial [Xylographa bjoerkii]|nr:Zinc finger and SCAN domain-containing protein 5B [Xylographa bjoerkii]